MNEFCCWSNMKKSWKIILIWMILCAFWMIKKIRLFDFEIFLKIDVKIADESFNSIKINYNNIYFSIKNLYVMKWSVEFFWTFKKNENIISINALHFWSKLMHMFLLWLIEKNFSIFLFLMNLYVKKIFLSTTFSKNSIQHDFLIFRISWKYSLRAFLKLSKSKFE